MYQTTDTIAHIQATTYINAYRDVDKFIGFCKQCGEYGNCWSCPPFSFDTEEYLSGYENVLIIGTKITPDAPLLLDEQAGRDIIALERSKLDNALLALERRYPSGKAFFAGFCNSCGKESCTRNQGKPCRHPQNMRPSLESLGFDIGRTASDLLGIELKWSSDGTLPEYLTLVSGFFTNHHPNTITWTR